MLRTVNIYLVVASVVNEFILLRTLLASVGEITVTNLFLTVLIIAAAGYCLYSNLMLVLNINESLTIHFLRYNFWYNIIQVPTVFLWGFIYIFSVGTEWMPYLMNNGNIIFSLEFRLFKVVGRFEYDPDQSTYLVGINLIPLLIAIFLNRQIRERQRAKEDDMIREIGSAA